MEALLEPLLRARPRGLGSTLTSWPHHASDSHVSLGPRVLVSKTGSHGPWHQDSYGSSAGTGARGTRSLGPCPATDTPVRPCALLTAHALDLLSKTCLPPPPPCPVKDLCGVQHRGGGLDPGDPAQPHPRLPASSTSLLAASLACFLSSGVSVTARPADLMFGPSHLPLQGHRMAISARRASNSLISQARWAVFGFLVCHLGGGGGNGWFPELDLTVDTQVQPCPLQTRSRAF